MTGLKEKFTALESLSFCVWLLALSRILLGHEIGPGVVKVAVKEGSDVILPCSLSNEQSLAPELFDWKKDGQKEVFLYDAGIHYNNGRAGQDEQFKGRVSHFSQELKNGNASIMIQNTKMADSGNYTCAFPRLQPKEQIFHIELVVGATPDPVITIADVTALGVQLQCDIQGAFPQPKLQWQDSAGNILPAEESWVSGRGGSYDVTLRTTVTKSTTDSFHCVVNQDHMVNASITVSEKVFEDSKVNVAGWFLGGSVLGFSIAAAVQALLVATKCITIQCNKGTPPDSQPV